MDLLRFEDKDVGPVYLDARFNFIVISQPEMPTSKVMARDPAGIAASLDIVGDPDEIAQAIERAVPGARVHRIV